VQSGILDPRDTGDAWTDAERGRSSMTPNDAAVLEETDDLVVDQPADEVDELLVEEVSIDGMCGVY
jgi:mycofactocin precursor